MALENIANEDLLIEFSNTAGPPDIVYTGDKGLTYPGVAETLSTKCKALAKKIATTLLEYIFSSTVVPCPHTSGNYNFVSGTGTITATATKCRAESALVMREGDSGLCAGSWTLKVSPFTAVACACDTQISSAGQSKVKGQ